MLVEFNPINSALVWGAAGMGIGSIAGYLLGYMVGSRKYSGKDEPLADPINRFLIFVVSIAWIVSVFVDMYSAEYTTPFNLYILMGVIVSVGMKVKISDVLTQLFKK